MKEEWPRLLFDFLVLVLIGGLITLALGWWIPNELKPRTNILVECNIKEGTNANHVLNVVFYNKADFAGKNLYVYLRGITSSSWGSDYSVSELCKRIQDDPVDFIDRVKIVCSFIPPKSEFLVSIDTKLNKEIISKKSIEIEWWGETTPRKRQMMRCTYS